MKRILMGTLAVMSFGMAEPGAAHGPAKPAVAAGRVDAGAEEPARVVDAFHTALAAGDTVAALALLAEDAVIYESGGVELGKAEYASHHLEADAAFSKAVPSQVTRRTGGVAGSVAWILTEGRTAGSFRDRPVDRVTTETAMLRQNGRAWRITHFHWSSAAAKAAR